MKSKHTSKRSKLPTATLLLIRPQVAQRTEVPVERLGARVDVVALPKRRRGVVGGVVTEWKRYSSVNNMVVNIYNSRRTNDSSLATTSNGISLSFKQ